MTSPLYMLLESTHAANEVAGGSTTVLTPMLTPEGNLMAGSLEEVTQYLADLQKNPEPNGPQYVIAEQNEELKVPKLLSPAMMKDIQSKLGNPYGTKPQITAANDGVQAQQALLSSPANTVARRAPGLAA